jgi:hypothetical protein
MSRRAQIGLCLAMLALTLLLRLVLKHQHPYLVGQMLANPTQGRANMVTFSSLIRYTADGFAVVLVVCLLWLLLAELLHKWRITP